MHNAVKKIWPLLLIVASARATDDKTITPLTKDDVEILSPLRNHLETAIKKALVAQNEALSAQLDVERKRQEYAAELDRRKAPHNWPNGAGPDDDWKCAVQLSNKSVVPCPVQKP